MKESTQMRNHLAAPSVTRHSETYAILRNMKESTLERNHSAAQGVTRNSPHWII